MRELLRRQFVVRVPLAEAWARLARVEEWPSWAVHIRQISLTPAGPLGEDSSGVIHLKNGMRTAFRMSEFDPPRSWAWAGKFLSLVIHYDHRFEPVGAASTRMIWIVRAEGPLTGLLGPLFAWIYGRNLDRAIPRLVHEWEGGAA